MTELVGKALYLGIENPKVPVKVLILNRNGGGVYGAAVFANKSGKGKGELRTVGLMDRNRFVSEDELSHWLCVQWGFEVAQAEEIS